MKREISMPVHEHYDTLFAGVRDDMTGQGEEWLLEQRDASFERFRKIGFPTQRVEAWKYTDVSALKDRAFTSAAPYPLEPGALRNLPLLHSDETTFIFVDGYYSPELSSPELEDGVSVSPLLSATTEPTLKSVLMRSNIQMESAFACLNRALWCDGLFLQIAPQTKLGQRIHIVFVHSGAQQNVLVSPRLVVSVGSCAEARIAITHTSLAEGCILNNGVFDIDIDAGANVELCQTQALSLQSFHFCNTRIVQQRDSTLHSLDFVSGALLSRHDLRVSLAGAGCTLVQDGIMAARERQVVDAHTAIEHMHQNCKSRQLYKAILDDRATTVFNGLVRVHPGASGTDGAQMNQNLLLSTKAKANSEPELQIANDDVRCTHGSTVGQISAKELFYLESRGIAPDAARDMLARGFVEEVLYRLDDSRRREDLHMLLDHYFENTGRGGVLS